MNRSKHQALFCWNLLNGQASLSGAKWMAQMSQKTRSLRPKIFKIDAPELLRCQIVVLGVQKEVVYMFFSDDLECFDKFEFLKVESV